MIGVENQTVCYLRMTYYFMYEIVYIYISHTVFFKYYLNETDVIKLNQIHVQMYTEPPTQILYVISHSCM